MELIDCVVNQLTRAIVNIPGSSSGETYPYTIVKASDGASFASGNMSYIAGYDWQTTFTADTEDTYLLRVPHLTIDQIIYGANYVAKTAVSTATLSDVANNSLSALELVNEVLKNNGLKTITVLTNMDKVSQYAFDKLNKHIVNIGQKEYWIPLEATGTITLVEDQRSYNLESDLLRLDEDSFMFGSEEIDYMSKNEFDRTFPEESPSNAAPSALCREKNTLKLNAPTLEADDGKTIRYRYWVDPPKLDVNYPDVASWFPKGFDVSVLVSLATYDLMVYRDMAEALSYKVETDGTFQNESTYSQMLRAYKSPVSDVVDVIGIV